MERRALLRRILLRLAAAMALFTLAMVRQTGLPALYGSIFRALYGPALGLLLPGVDAELRPHVPKSDVFSADQMHDSELVLVNRRTVIAGSHPKGEQPLSSLWLGYVPTALFLALVLPTPISWRRRGRALFFGLLLVQAFVLARLLLLAIDILSRPTALALFHPGEGARKVLSFCTEMVTTELFPGYLVPLVIWVLVSFRSSDQELWREAPAAAPG